jgi:hypothetical protein
LGESTETSHYFLRELRTLGVEAYFSQRKALLLSELGALRGEI